MAEPRNLLSVWAELLMDTLACAGVREVVLSPGSRSTPFALAAARHGSLRVHPILDERAAGFFALGIARVTGAPPVLLCTSGTAPAHYYPAVIEASESALPLIVLSADRPFALSGCGAPQTIDQTRLFGAHARSFTELGEPSAAPRALRALRRALARAVSEARGPLPGPVHLNARAEKPLEPREAESDEERALASLARSIAEEPLVDVSARLEADASALARIAEQVARAERPAIVAGPLPIDAPRDAILALARRCGLALFAEGASQLRFAPREGVTCADAFDRWIDRAQRCDGRPTAAADRKCRDAVAQRSDPCARAHAAPDVVIELGATPTSAAYARWLDGGGPRARFVLGGSRFRDPSGRAELVALGALEPMIAALAAKLPARPIDPAFASAIAQEEARAWSAVERALGDAGALAEGAVARTLIEALPRRALLAVGNSLPIRHLDRFVLGGRAELRVLSQRGVNGIDGAIAGIAGAALAGGGPAALFAGDVTLAHDLGSLAIAARLRSPLALVVLDNGGGRIFEQLPLGRAGLSEAELALFTTPPAIDFAAAASAFGVGYALAEDARSLETALERALSDDRATLVHARVPPDGVARVEARVAALLAEER